MSFTYGLLVQAYQIQNTTSVSSQVMLKTYLVRRVCRWPLAAATLQARIIIKKKKTLINDSVIS